MASGPQTIARDGSNILWFEIDCGKQPRYSYNDDQMTPAGICRESGQGHARQKGPSSLTQFIIYDREFEKYSTADI